MRLQLWWEDRPAEHWQYANSIGNDSEVVSLPWMIWNKLTYDLEQRQSHPSMRFLALVQGASSCPEIRAFKKQKQKNSPYNHRQE